jgi:glycosyltransferase involved in cell wall biosynthesis
METLAILIPVKNNARNIHKALQSIEHQTAFLTDEYKYKIFLVDNDSSDNLKEVVTRYKNLTYLFCKTPGIVAALNTGLFHIMNEPNIKYVARIDSDDYWVSNKIEKQFGYMLKHPEIDICGTAIRFIKDNCFNEWHYGESHNQIMADLDIGQNPIAHSSVIYKKDIFLKCGGYDESYKYSEDLDLWMRASKHFIFHNMQEVLLYYSNAEKSKEYYEEQSESVRKIYLRRRVNKNEIR